MIAKTNKYDFIVVGAGPAGCAVATRLAESTKAPSVLLVEAGSKNDDKHMRIDGERWITFMNPNMNWGYKTTPQPGLNDREIDYSRGKGLGGSSAINFAVYDIGPRDDFGYIAQLAGDESWDWKNAQPRFRRLETFHGKVPTPYEKYIDPKPEDHGSEGKIHIGFPKVWEKTHGNFMNALEDSGHKLNPDLNSGVPIGWGFPPSSAHNGLRTTSADLLVNSPENLTIVTEQAVRQIIFDGTQAVGIETESESYYAKNEVIVSCGSLDTPKLLMLSGVGPAEELAKLDIPVVHDAKYVGKNLRDHSHVTLIWKQADSSSDKWRYYRSAEARAAAREQWLKDGNGPLALYDTDITIGFFKNEHIYDSAEFEALPEETKQHLQASTVPSYEFIAQTVDLRDLMNSSGSEASNSVFVFLLNGQARGSVTLKSKDPKDPPLLNPKAFAHPFDRRVAIEATREILSLIQLPALSKDTTGVVNILKSDTDEDILAFWREHATSTWHMSGTVKTGKAGEEDACVDNDLRVFGTTSLRVVNMSISPILPNNHTQTTAYYIGATAGDKLVAEYDLD